jgi:TolB-like protein/DNA-binding SARP family transcriptional activator/Flp pilus assembly protein TadD
MFRLRVLGGFALDAAASRARSRPQRRGDAVLAVLAVYGDLGCTRERLAALLWPESDESRSRHSLRDALHAIRRAVAPGAVVTSGRLLRIDGTVVASDVGAFGQALAGGRLADAAHLYGGPLLDGFHVDGAAEFDHWLDGERSRLARQYGEALEQLAVAAERDGAWLEAAGWWARAVEHDPLNSRVVLRQMRALDAIGDRANAVRAADTHARRLRTELDVEPDHAVLAASEEMRRGAAQGARVGAAPRAASAEPAVVASGTARAVAPRPRRARWWVGVAAVLILAGTLGLGPRLKPHTAQSEPPHTMLALLPFQNLGRDSSHAYIAGGLHDELVSQLARVASLRVVGRQSVREYRETAKPLRKIGQELGVGSVVEASVQVDGSRLRVIAQLVDPATGQELWAARYDRTLDDVLAVESDIAQRIVVAVGATLTNEEAGAIAAAPTGSPEAYAFYLQGLDYRRRPGALRQNLEGAEQLFERALALDGTFAAAHAALSSVHWALYHLRYDRSVARLERARREADTALRLAPDLPQAHVAVSLARDVERGADRDALAELRLALDEAPNDAELWAWMGWAYRNAGQWDSALVALARAERLDPRDADLWISMGNTLHYLHRYPEAIAAYRRALALAPDLVEPHLSLAWSYALWTGDLDTLRAALSGLPPDGDPGGGGDGLGEQRLALLAWERQPDSILALLRTMDAAAGAHRRPPAGRGQWAAEAYLLSGDTADARRGFESALAALDSAERAAPDDPGVHGGRGAVLAALGRRAEAMREERWLERSALYRTDRYRQDAGIAVDAVILMRVGETDAALDRLERLLAGPSLVTVQQLRLDPTWDPIRGDPRFQRLLARYATPAALTVAARSAPLAQ